MDSALIGVLSNLGTGGVVIVLIILGYLIPKGAHTRVLEESARKDETIDKLQEALDLERQRGNDVAAAGTVTNQLIAAVVNLATEHREHADDVHSGSGGIPAVPVPLDLTGKDLGL